MGPSCLIPPGRLCWACTSSCAGPAYLSVLLSRDLNKAYFPQGNIGLKPQKRMMAIVAHLS